MLQSSSREVRRRIGTMQRRRASTSSARSSQYRSIDWPSMCSITGRAVLKGTRPREDRPFAREPFLARSSHERDVEQFDRDMSLETPVAALSKPDTACPPLPDERHETVRAKHVAGERLNEAAARMQQRALEKVRFVHDVLLGEQDAQVGGQRWIICANGGKPYGSLVRRFPGLRRDRD